MKESDLRDLALTIFPTLALTLPRQMYLVLILVYLKHYALIILVLELLILMIVASFYFKNDRSKAIMGAIASIFGPCFRVVLHIFRVSYFSRKAKKTQPNFREKCEKLRKILLPSVNPSLDLKLRQN